MRKLIALALVLSFVAVPSFAGIRESAAKIASQAPVYQGPASQSNPYLWPSVGLMSGGVSLMLIGFLNPTDVECKTTGDYYYDVGVNCGTKANKGLVIAGLATAGLGGFLFYKGEQTKQRSAPFVTPVKGGWFAGQTVKF